MVHRMVVYYKIRLVTAVLPLKLTRNFVEKLGPADRIRAFVWHENQAVKAVGDTAIDCNVIQALGVHSLPDWFLTVLPGFLYATLVP